LRVPHDQLEGAGERHDAIAVGDAGDREDLDLPTAVLVALPFLIWMSRVPTASRRAKSWLTELPFGPMPYAGPPEIASR